MAQDTGGKVVITVFLIFFMLFGIGIAVESINSPWGFDFFTVVILGMSLILPLIILISIWTGKIQTPGPMGSLINRQHTANDVIYCPICHANMGNSTKCPECGHVKE